MQYPQYREQGWPIGSGMVESANKVVVEARLKGGAGIGTLTLSIPCSRLPAVCNVRWQACWYDISTQQSQHQLLCRKRQAISRLQPLVSRLMLLLLQFRPPTLKSMAAPPRPVAPAATLPDSSRS